MFCSSKHVAIFDPMAEHIPELNPANPGKIIDFVQKKDLIKSKYADQFSPLRAFGNNLNKRFDGTLFRLPLRLRESRISKQCHDIESMMTTLEEFAHEASSMLLFLKHVQRVSVMIWEEGRNEPDLLHDATIRCDRAMMLKRQFITTAMEKEYTTTKDFEIRITCTNVLEKKETVEEWILCNQLEEDVQQMAIDEAIRTCGSCQGSAAARIGGVIEGAPHISSSSSQNWVACSREWIF